MRVVFVDNFFYLRSTEGVEVTISPQLGLMSLAAILEAAGHTVSIVDPKLIFSDGGWKLPSAEFYDAWATSILALEPQMIGFTALGRTLPHAIEAARRVRSLSPAAPIVLGGPQATILSGPVLESFDCFDVVVRHEAEPLILEIVEAICSGSDLSTIPNLAYRTPAGVVLTPEKRPLPDMNQLPIPSYHLYPHDALVGKELAVEAGRGCPFACTFCSTANFFQRRYRLKANDRIISEMELLREKYGTQVFDLNHDLFGLNKKMLRDFCVKVTGRGLKWKCSMRPDTIDVSMLDQLREAGCVSIYFGIESGSARMQSIIAKKLNLDSAIRSVQLAVEAGLVCTASFIAGFPEERQEDLAATLDVIGRLAALEPDRLTLQLHVLSPEPGSELAEREYEIAFDGIGPEMDDLVDPELIKNDPTTFSVFYHFPTILPRRYILYCSMFVSFVMPQLGWRLLTFILKTFPDGRLSALIDEILPESEANLSFDAMMSALWRGLSRVVETRMADAPYVAELIRFNRILVECHNLRAAESSATMAGIEGPVGDILIAPFDFRVAEIAEGMMTSPESLGRQAIKPSKSWYSFHRRESGEIAILPLQEGDVYSVLDEVASGAQVDSSTSHRLLSLGATVLAA